MNTSVRLELLTPAHARRLERFELDNRAFFATRISDRGDEYFSTFDERHAELVQENRDGRSLLAALVTPSNEIVGRVNLLDIDQPGPAELGFRVAENVQGQGFSSTGVGLMLDLAATRGVREVCARASTTNVASQRVLEKCGFEAIGAVEPPAGVQRSFVGYRKQLDSGAHDVLD